MTPTDEIKLKARVYIEVLLADIQYLDAKITQQRLDWPNDKVLVGGISQKAQLLDETLDYLSDYK